MGREKRVRRQECVSMQFAPHPPKEKSSVHSTGRLSQARCSTIPRHWRQALWTLLSVVDGVGWVQGFEPPDLLPDARTWPRR